MSNRGVYTVRDANTQTAAKTLAQIVAGANFACELLYASITNATNDASDSSSAQILRKSTPATVTSFTPLVVVPNDVAANAVGGTALTGVNASVEGTNGDIIWDEGFNILNGWVWMPTPEFRIFVDTGECLGIKMNTSITSAEIHVMMVFSEVVG